MSTKDRTVPPLLPDDEGARSFAMLLHELNAGTFLTEISQANQKLVKEIADQANSIGKADGTLTITLKFKAEDNGTVTIDPDVKVKSPKPLRKRGLFYVTKGANLILENPKQQKLGLAEVPPPKPAIAAPDPVKAPAPNV